MKFLYFSFLSFLIASCGLNEGASTLEERVGLLGRPEILKTLSGVWAGECEFPGPVLSERQSDGSVKETVQMTKEWIYVEVSKVETDQVTGLSSLEFVELQGPKVEDADLAATLEQADRLRLSMKGEEEEYLFEGFKLITESTWIAENKGFRLSISMPKDFPVKAEIKTEYRLEETEGMPPSLKIERLSQTYKIQLPGAPLELDSKLETTCLLKKLKVK